MSSMNTFNLVCKWRQKSNIWINNKITEKNIDQWVKGREHSLNLSLGYGSRIWEHSELL